MRHSWSTAFRSLVFVLASGVSSGWAQIPVTDVASIAKQVEQLIAWGKQYKQMIEQIQLAKNQLEAISGSRNLGAIIDTIGIERTVPSEIVQQWRELQRAEDLIKGALSRTDDALKATKSRSDQVRLLMQAINTTKDPKGVAEIQARMSAEVAMITNDFQRVQLMAMQQQQNMERIENTIRDASRKALAKPSAF